jgi:sigma-B regulation protein RsbU (phosphoserine phosphatase)
MDSLPAGGIPLGIFEDTAFEEGERTLAPGDSLLMYSDGISEASNSFSLEFGEDRVDALWRKHGADPTATVLDRLFAAVLSFHGGAPQSDDQTALVLGPVPGA